jgi:hypothetical protein
MIQKGELMPAINGFNVSWIKAVSPDHVEFE